MKAEPLKGNGGQIAAKPTGLIVRNFRQMGAPTPRRHWVRGDPFATAFFNALSVAFPKGEALMVSSMAAWRGKMPPKLDADLRKFLEQEAAHSREHGDMNAAIEKSGYDISELEKVVDKLVILFRGRSDMTRLMATACIEHFTAIIAAEVLENDAHLAGADEEQLPIWIWHAIEEVEHKAVAYDCFVEATKHWSGARRWLLRSLLMTAITASFCVNRTRGQVALLKQDGFSGGQALAGALLYGFGKDGLGRNVLKPWLRFFRPGFNPSQIDDSRLIAKGEAKFARLQAALQARAAGQGATERRRNIRLSKAA